MRVFVQQATNAQLRAWWCSGDWKKLAPALDGIARCGVGALCDSDDELDDCAQHTVVRCWRMLKVPDNPANYAVTIARNALKDFRKHHSSKRLHGVVNEVTLHELECSAPNPEDALLKKDRKTRLMAAVAGLPERKRDLFLMRMHKEYSYAEISRRTKAPEGRLKMQMHLICKMLAAQLLAA